MPFFVTHGHNVKNPIGSMPGQYQLSIDCLLVEIKKVVRKKIPAVLLFGIPKKKDLLGKEATADDGIVQQAIRILKKRYPKLILMADLCFCEYTTHGHCGVIKNKKIDNSATLALIRQAATAQAKAGVDYIAPSGMTPGAVRVIRNELDKGRYKKVGIMAYSAKFCSSFYGPFREAALSAPKFGDRKSYQLNPGKAHDAIKKLRTDVKDGADMVMVKPALSYLDIMARIKPELKIPLVGYNVSGEYAMVKAAAANGWLDEKKVVLEILISIKRAGADLIITYHALEVAKWI